MKRRRPTKRHTAVPAKLIADIQVWRAAIQIDPSDLRPPGHPQLGRATRIFQQQLDKRLAAYNGDWRWRQLLATKATAATANPFLPEQAERLHSLCKAGFDATLLVSPAAAAVPLADHHPAAALWWRILDQLPRTNLEPGPSDNQHRPSDQAHAREVSWSSSDPGRARRRPPAVAGAAEPRLPSHHHSGDGFR